MAVDSGPRRWGALNVTVSWAVLGGALPTSGGVDRRAQLGHAALWDPLFLVWGLCLLVGVRAHSRASARFVRDLDGH
jgi:hypothetical protein